MNVIIERGNGAIAVAIVIGLLDLAQVIANGVGVFGEPAERIDDFS